MILSITLILVIYGFIVLLMLKWNNEETNSRKRD